MAARKSLLVKAVLGAVLLAIALFALFYLPLIIALITIAVALVFVLAGSLGRRSHHKDALSNMQADAAQRGDAAAFMGRSDDINIHF